MSKLRELSRELGAEIIYFIPSENDIVLIGDIKGLYLPEYDIIYIRDDLTIIEQENVILDVYKRQPIILILLFLSFRLPFAL